MRPIATSQLVRLLHAGVRRKDGMFVTGVIHLWHAEADQSRLSENERKRAEVTAIELVRNAATCDLGGKMFRPR